MPTHEVPSAQWLDAPARTSRVGPIVADVTPLPSPAPRAVLWLLVSFLAVAVAWALVGRLDVVAVAPGKIVPQRSLKVVQPAESGIVREILIGEGELVAQGAVLMRMDASLSQAERRTLQGELALRELHLRRIDAELDGTPFARRAGDPDELFARVAGQHEARVGAQRAAIAAEQALAARTREELAAASEVETKLARTAPIYAEQERAWGELVREGFAGRLFALDRQRSRIENEQDLRAQAANVAGLRATLELADRRLAQLVATYRRELAVERVEMVAQRDRIAHDLARHGHRAGLLDLRAPAAGRVKDLATHTPGTVVAPGTILATIVPAHEPLEAEVWISNIDAGRVVPGQTVRVKVNAFPFQRFGTVEGVLRHVSPDATDRPEPAGTRVPADALRYRALVTLRDPIVLEGERRRTLTAGMQVVGEIHLGTRSVAEYLLSPLRRVAHEAAREP